MMLEEFEQRTGFYATLVQYEAIDDDAAFRDDYEAYDEFEWECRTGR